MLSMFSVLLAVVPQGEVRSVGRVMGLDGEPVADASVTFLSRPIPRSLEAEPVDRREVRTDARGMFRIELAAGARYTVWAAWDAAATGFAEGVEGGEFLELRGVAGTAPLRVALVGADAWAESAGFRLRAIVGGENIDFCELQRDGDMWRLPALPRKTWRHVEVLDARGEVLWADNMRQVEGRVELHLPPPREYAVEVVDAAGAPIAGAEVCWHIRNYWYSESEALQYGDRFRALWPVVGSTDAAGKATVRAPWPADERDLWLLTRKDGYAMSVDGYEDGKRFANGNVIANDRVPDEEPVRVALQSAQPVDVPIRDQAGLPAADRWLYAIARVHVKDDNSGTGTPFTMTLPVREGRARLLSPLPPGSDLELAEVVLPERVTGAIAERHGFAPCRAFRVAEPEKLLAGDGAVALAFEDDRVLRVTAPDGRPAARAVVVVDEGRSDGRRRIQRTDRLGRALLPKGRALRIGVLGASSIGGTRSAADAVDAVDLQLQPLVALPIRVVDGEGQAVAGVGVQPNLAGLGDGSDDDVAWCADALLPLRSAIASDARGRLSLLLPPLPGTIGLVCERRRVVSGENFAWDPEAPAERELVVGPAR